MIKLQNLIKIPLIWRFSILAIIVVTMYWSIFASDRYVSTAHVVLQSPEIAAPEFNFSSMLSGSASNNKSDLLLLRDVLLSVDMLKLLDQKLDLRSHYSQTEIDWFSRMSSKQEPIEFFHKYYLKRVDIYLDDYSGVLVVNASAFSAQMAQEITRTLLKEGERQINEMGQRLATEQVKFIEKQVVELSQRLEKTRVDVLNYQNKEGMISPTAIVESASAVIAQLESELVSLSAQKNTLASFQSSKSAQMLQLSSQIKAIKNQIQLENNKLTATQGTALNKITADYETLKLKAQFAQEMYSNGLATLEATRVEAARKLKQVSVLQAPTLPEYSIEPNSLQKIVVYSLFILIFTLILNLMMLIVKEHKD
jgi:capsular polysaccharide transport system permease protein